MAEATKEEVPANAPWLQSWKTVAKASGEYKEPEKPQEGPVEAVKRVIKPWLMDWGLIAKESPVDHPKTFTPPSPVDVSTEAKMKKALYIAPHEVQAAPVEESPSYKLSEIDSELARKPPESIRKILLEERKKLSPDIIEPGKFASVAASNAYAKRLYKDQEKLYKGK